jgi:hypothetical protein
MGVISGKNSHILERKRTFWIYFGALKKGGINTSGGFVKGCMFLT